MKKLVFTGGHHSGAILVAKELSKKGYEIVWFGHRYSMWGDTSDSAEYKEVTSAGFKFYDLKAGKFYRTFNPLKVVRIPWGFIQALVWLMKERPAGIVSFGGYLAVPTVICGWLMGIPSITHEQTTVEGWANKLIGRFVKKIALTWPQSAASYSKNKTVVVGLPVRDELLSFVPKAKKGNTIYITGGKQGSHLLNRTVFASFPELTTKYKLIHQTGSSSLSNDYEAARSFTSNNYKAFDFDSAKAIDAFREADVVVGRSGAHTAYELAILGKPCVLVPIPWVSHNEQEANARLLEAHGIAVVLLEKDLSTQNLLQSIEKAMKFKANPMILPRDATQRLVELVEKELG